MRAALATIAIFAMLFGLCGIVYSWGYRDGKVVSFIDAVRTVKCESTGEFVK